MTYVLGMREDSNCREVFKVLTGMSGVAVPVAPPDRKDKAKIIVLQREGGISIQSTPSAASVGKTKASLLESGV